MYSRSGGSCRPTIASILLRLVGRDNLQFFQNAQQPTLAVVQQEISERHADNRFPKWVAALYKSRLISSTTCRCMVHFRRKETHFRLQRLAPCRPEGPNRRVSPL